MRHVFAARVRTVTRNRSQREPKGANGSPKRANGSHKGAKSEPKGNQAASKVDLRERSRKESLKASASSVFGSEKSMRKLMPNKN